ncbi:Uu.00g021380.m01.CDS01 [Anthostomella pinea]|uniref:Uu.00g021380.m01.CDS01 n=1 Tax=Anthostomella pinea TaxID=933095 RepID=A0AAI8VZM6_9PEZI|nr:Uu.00g021380.m01.CDS01 [Anthostomella pinea]
MVLAKILSFDPAAGWKKTGSGVKFDKSLTSQDQATARSESPSTAETSHATTLSSVVPDADLWLNVGIIYRAGILLYMLRTLVLDISEDKSYLHEANPSLEIATLRLETRRVLASALAPIFSDSASTKHLGKLVFFPVFVCGMEAGQGEKALQEFIVHGLEMLGRMLGTFGPVSAVDELRGKWAADAAAGAGGDGCYLG